MIFIQLPIFQRVDGFRRLIAMACGIGFGTLTTLHGADGARSSFDLPADMLETSVKRFAAQSGRELLIPSDALAEVRTRTVRGEMTSRQALDAMLAGTGLTVLQDPKTGAFAIRKEITDPNAQRTAHDQNSDRPKTKKKVTTSTPLQNP